MLLSRELTERVIVMVEVVNTSLSLKVSHPKLGIG